MKDPRINYNTPIEFFLNGKSLGSYYVKEGSMASDRIALAKSKRIDYYDGFILRGGKFYDNAVDSRNVVMPDGKPLDDFKPYQERIKQLNND